MIDSVLRSFREHRKLAVAALIMVCSAGLYGWVHSVKRDPTAPVFQVQPKPFTTWSE